MRAGHDDHRAGGLLAGPSCPARPDLRRGGRGVFRQLPAGRPRRGRRPDRGTVDVRGQPDGGTGLRLDLSTVEFRRRLGTRERARHRTAGFPERRVGEPCRRPGRDPGRRAVRHPASRRAVLVDARGLRNLELPAHRAGVVAVHPSLGNARRTATTAPTDHDARSGRADTSLPHARLPVVMDGVHPGALAGVDLPSPGRGAAADGAAHGRLAGDHCGVLADAPGPGYWVSRRTS